MSKKISELPLYSGSAQPLGDVPISINGTTYRIDPILLINLSFKADLIDGKVPISQLPSYVSDIIEVANYAALPTTGETSKIYVTLDNNHIFRWSGSAYIEITDNTAVWGAVTGNLTDQTDIVNVLNTKVPYTGATSNVDLGEYQIKTGQIEFDQTPTGTAGVAKLRWNDTDGTLEFMLKGGNVTLQVGQEQVVRVVNKTGSNILEANYQAVRFNGAQGQRPKIALAQATNDANSADTIGLVTENINSNQEGFVTVQGLVNGINTTGSLQGETWADGDLLYLSPTIAGGITNVKPTAPNHSVLIGYLIYAHAVQGRIYVNVQNGYELEELHNVAINSLIDNQILTYEYATSLWKNKSLGTIIGGTSSQFVKGDGSLDSNSYALVSQIHNAVTIGTANGLSLSTQVLSLGLASATTNGALSSTDWNTFNGKQNALNGTGFVKISGTTISYDNSTYALDSAVVKLTSNQSVAGEKTFTNLAKFTNGTGLFAIEIDTTVTDAIVVKDSGTTKLQIGRNGEILAKKYKVDGGFSQQFLKANGDLDSNTYATTSQLHNAVTIGTANGLSLSTQVLSLGLASAGVTGALSGTDWSTFNNKEPAISAPGTVGQYWRGNKTFATLDTSVVPENVQLYFTDARARTAVTGNSGTTNYIPKFTGSGTLGNSIITSNGDTIRVTSTSDAVPFSVLNTFSSISTIGFAGNSSVTTYNTRVGVDGNDFIAYTNNTERLRITSSGNVGIGTTSPSALLDVNGKAVFGSGSVSSPSISFRNSTNTGFYQTDDGSGALINMAIGATNIATFKYNGNVGIGTTSPDAPLGFANALGDKIKFNSGAGNSYKIGLATAINGGDALYKLSVGDSSAGEFGIFNGGSYKFFVNNIGNVGIGTTSPNTLLQVGSGGGGTTNSIMYLGGYNNTTSQLRYIMNHNGAANAGIGTPSNGGILFGYGLVDGTISGEWVRITSNGNVGIGTTSPSYQLQLSTDSAAKPTSALWTIASDERIKENIKPYTKGLNELMLINAITYDYNGLGGFKKGKGGVGIIAQQIQEILPDSVSSIKAKLNENDKEETDILNFNGHELTYVLINAIKELKAEIEILKN